MRFLYFNKGELRIELERGRENSSFPVEEGWENRGFPSSEIAKRLPSGTTIKESNVDTLGDFYCSWVENRKTEAAEPVRPLGEPWPSPDRSPSLH